MSEEPKKFKWKSKTEEVKQPHSIPDPPPPSNPPETEREPNVVTSKIESSRKENTAEEEAVRQINNAINCLKGVNSDESILAIGKLNGALDKLGLRNPKEGE